MTRRVRMRDVADMAGVSPTLVSFVLSGRNDMRIAEETRQKVLEVARELEYRPNKTARILRTQVTHTLGFVSDGVVTDEYVGDLIRGSLLQAAAEDHHLLIGELTKDPEAPDQVVHDLLDRQVDGFIYASSWTQAVRVPEALTGQRVVLLNCIAEGPYTSVVPDDAGAGRAAVQTLLEAGHTAGIVLVGETPAHVVAAARRLEAMSAALGQAGHRLLATVDTVWWPAPSYEATSRFLAGQPEVTAMICLNDRVALGVYQALAGAGLRVPEDVSVLSFDDSSLASWLRPELTSVALPYQEMGQRAVAAVLDRTSAPGEIKVATPVRHRGSVRPPPRSMSNR
jgi:LacI family transcriptional regulator